MSFPAPGTTPPTHVAAFENNPPFAVAVKVAAPIVVNELTEHEVGFANAPATVGTAIQ